MLEAKLEDSKARTIFEGGRAFDKQQDETLESSFNEVDRVSEVDFSLLGEGESASKFSGEGVMTSKDETLSLELDSEIILSLRSKSGQKDG